MKHLALKLSKIVELLGIEHIVGSTDFEIHGVATLADAKEGDISFLSNPKYSSEAAQTNASAIIVDKHTEIETTATLLRCPNPYATFAKYLHFLEQKFIDNKPQEGLISKEATIDATAIISPDAIVESGVSIGPRSEIRAGAKILRGSIIGADCIVDAGAIIGGEGFGWAPDEKGEFQRIPQLGNVVLADKVYIGANTTVDRAALGSTYIGEGTKIDNLCMIAHNVKIGKHTVIAAQTGIAGSTTVGDHCMFGGQVGIAGHLKIGNRVKILAQSGVMSDVSDNRTIFGTPALDHRHYLKSFAAFKRQGK